LQQVSGAAGRTDKINILEEMESMKRITLVATIALAGAFGLAGCAGQASKGDAMAKDPELAAYTSALAEAKAELKKAKKVDGEWRDIGKFLKNADKAAKKGDYKTAMKLVKKSTFQAKMGQKQAAEQAGVGNPDYMN
jgi:hypothetical protein